MAAESTQSNCPVPNPAPNSADSLESPASKSLAGESATVNEGVAQRPFQPLFRNAHTQTFLGVMWSRPEFIESTTSHVVKMADGDHLVLHDNCPEEWSPGDRVVLLMHGLDGSSESPYIVRLSKRLYELGLRVFRLDFRCCGAALWLCRRTYHAGRSDDVRTVLTRLAELCPNSKVTLYGMSMGANVALKTAGEIGAESFAGLDSVAVLCPPVDLESSVASLAQPRCWAYEKYFVRGMRRKILEIRHRLSPVLEASEIEAIQTIRQFDTVITARLCGFESAEDYYTRCSSRPLLSRIALPTLIIASRDDPLIPPEPLETADLSSSIELTMTDHGGHCAYLGVKGQDPDRHWVDWRVREWIQTRL